VRAEGIAPRIEGPNWGHRTLSLLNDITAVVGARPAIGSAGQQPTLGTGQPPGGPSAVRPVPTGYTSVFTSTFADTMATVYERGASGEFDDRSLALEEQAALQRLRVAQQAAGATPITTGGVGGGGPAEPAPEPGGADAAPTADATTSMVAVAEQRNVYAVRVRQSEARLSNISGSLKRDFPLAAQLVSASTGTWDPATFVPQTQDQAAAFAQRLVIDATEAAARLEIVKTQLDAARFELAQGGGAEVAKLVVDLEAGYERQKAYVDKLAGIVDGQSSGQMSDAGARALSGDTMRDINDLPVAEIAAALKAEGMSDEQIARVVGAGELAVEQEKTPGGSEHLKKISSDLTRSLINQFNQRVREGQQETQRQEQQRTEQRRIDDKRAERRRTEERATEKRIDERQAERVLTEQTQLQRAARQDAEFQQWLVQLSAKSGQRRAG
jgi:hypothetical protein